MPNVCTHMAAPSDKQLTELVRARAYIASLQKNHELFRELTTKGKD